MVRYFDLLESLFLIHRLPAGSRNLTKRQIQRPKVFLIDTGLNAALSNMDAAHLSSMQGADHLGPLLEQFVVCELLRHQEWSATPFKLFHYRDRQGAEVDIIVETPAGIIAVEVTSTAAATARHFQHLKALRDRLGDEFLAGIVLTTGTGQNPAIGSNRIASLLVAVVVMRRDSTT
ncbi:AAA ATPase [Cutibacterium acnes HL042PA3]|nr:AAA ATPase [Cutibacterium acnes HL042PA3]